MNEEEKELSISPLILLLIVSNTFLVGYLLYQQRKLSSLTDSIITKKNEHQMVEQQKGQNSIELTPKKDFIIETFPMKSITANLSRPNGPQRFITIEMVFMIETPQSKPAEEITNKMTNFRDEIINILNTLSPQDVLKLEGREVLKNKLKMHMNQNLIDDKVKRILFVQFKVS
jgi:flagellar basal body-associated protein FliL